MRHHHMHPGLAVLTFLLVLVCSPYILAALAFLAVVWLACFIVAVVADWLIKL